MIGEILISNYASGGSGMAQHLAKKAKLSGLRFPWGQGGKDKILGRLFGKGGLVRKVLNLNQIQRQNVVSCS